MKLYRRLLRYLRPYLRQFFYALFFMCVVAATTAGAALLVRNVLDDILLVQEAVTIALASLLRDTITIAALIGVIFYRDWRLATIAVFFLPLAVYPLMRFGHTYR